MYTWQLRKAGAAIPALLIIIILTLAAAAHADEDNPVSILYYEPILLFDTPSNEQGLPAAVEIAPLVFDAYGRRFELQPDKTHTGDDPDFVQLRGQIAGLSGSWFSLLRNGQELSGVIADGEDTYFIEPRRRVAELLTTTSAGDEPVNVIFRLADMMIPQGLIACPTPDDALPAGVQIDGQSAVVTLGAELQTQTGSASVSDSLPLLVSVIADESFTEIHGAGTDSEIAAIFNIVQGIIAFTIGLEIEIDSVTAVTADTINPFSDTLSATSLLNELGNWRSVNQAHTGHTHLLTEKKLINDSEEPLAGLSYLGQPGRSGACNPRTGASLSRYIRGLTALIVTHELGHNLGAPHDGDSTSACASTPDLEFIMSTRISFRTSIEFSDCSLAEIDKFIANASCLNEPAQSLPANSVSGGGGGGALGWVSIAGLFIGIFMRRKRPARFS